MTDKSILTFLILEEIKKKEDDGLWVKRCELAKEAGITVDTLRRVLNSRRANIGSVMKVAKALNVEI